MPVAVAVEVKPLCALGKLNNLSASQGLTTSAPTMRCEIKAINANASAAILNANRP